MCRRVIGRHLAQTDVGNVHPGADRQPTIRVASVLIVLHSVVRNSDTRDSCGRYLFAPTPTGG